MLVLFSGLPGAGKTRLAQEVARRTGFPLFAKDRLQSALRSQGLTEREGAHGYRLVLDLADQQLSLGVGVVLDAVFPLQGFRLEARSIAKRHHVEFKPLFCYCSDEALWKQRLEGREQFVPHWSPVGWEEVERIRPNFEPWEEGAALFLDSSNNFESNLDAALSYLRRDAANL